MTPRIYLEFTPFQEQLLYGGRLGDGNFKKNGRGYLYREKHAQDEYEYLCWKAEMFKDMVTKKGVYELNPKHCGFKGYKSQPAFEFSLKTSSSLEPYALLSKSEVIPLLNEVGLMIFLLDDGWYSAHSKVGNFLISGGTLSNEDLENVCTMFDKHGIKGCRIIGKKRFDMSIPSSNNKLLYEIASSMIPEDVDIMKKKFYNISNK